jgi:hypothetical protein
MTALRETALAAIFARLGAQITTATIERARPAPVDVDKETLPRLVLTGTDWSADEAAEPMAVHYTLGFAITGYVRARTLLAAEQALAELQASTIAALSGWTPTTANLGEAAQEGTEFRLYDTEESKTPAGEFTARFSMLCLGPLVA